MVKQLNTSTIAKPFRWAGILMLGLGLLALYAMTPMLKNVLKQSDWIRTDCTVDTATLVSDQNGIDTLQLAYHLTVGGKRTNGTLFELPSSISRSETFYRQKLELLVPGAVVACYYDPALPEQVVIERMTWEDAALALIPAIFIGIGIVALQRGRSNSQESFSHPSIPDSAENKSAGGCGRGVFFSIFIIAGLGISYLFFGIPYLALQQTQSWTPASCTILDSRVAATASRDSKSGQSSNSYSLEVRYEYDFGGRHFVGNTYNAAGSRFMSSQSMYEKVEMLSSGSLVDCYIDPNDPTRSVIDRQMPERLFLALLPLILTLAGILGWVATSPDKHERSSSGTIRKRAQSPLRGLISYLMVTVLVNALVTSVVYGVCFNWGEGEINYLPLLFSIPFILLAALLLLGLPYVFLQLLNPTVEIELESEQVELGSAFSVAWTLQGNPNRVKEMVLELKPAWDKGSQTLNSASETAPSRLPGQDRSANEALKEIQRLMTLEVVKAFKTDNTQMIARGKTQFIIPSKERLTEISPLIGHDRWQLTVTLKIPWFPDRMETHTL